MTLRKQTLERVQDVLNDDRKKAWKELTGDTFQIVATPRRGNNQ